MKTVQTHDSATALTLAYLGAIESRLGVQWEAPNTPICRPEQFDANARKALKADLEDILKGTPSDKAISATKEFGQSHIQTVGFGLAPDFDQFVKLGFLYGERVVLWDFLADRLLVEKRKMSNSQIAQTACELLLLKPAVERGAVVLLPHPLKWSEFAEIVAEDLRHQETRSAAAFGLSMALCAVEDGLPLHPFTVLHGPAKPGAHAALAKHEGNLYSRENYVFQKAVASVLKDQQFAYLPGVSAAEFQRIVSRHEDLSHELRKIFGILVGMSEQQAAKESRQARKELTKLIASRNKEVGKHAAEGSEATLIFVTSLLTKLGYIASAGAVEYVGLTTRLFMALRKWFSAPKQNTIVQAFQALQQQQGEEMTETLRQNRQRPAFAACSPIKRTGSPPHGPRDEEFQEAREGFLNAGSWTEDSHEYLMSLPATMAAQVVRSLGASEREWLVNKRRFQEAYIADYLGDLWYINKTAFWKHAATMFRSPEGMIVSDCNDHLEVMGTENMPTYVWHPFLKCLLQVEILGRTGLRGYFPESYTAILAFQTTNASEKEQRQLEFCKWFKDLPHNERDAVLTFLRRTFAGKIPAWLRKHVKPASSKSLRS